jgi:hypothetical protein
VAARVPVVTGEFDQDVCNPSTFDADYMTWADQHGVGYLAWGWWVLSKHEIADAGCSAYYLITDAKGTPAAPNGINLHAHLVALASSGGGSPGTKPPGTKPTQPKLRSFGARLNADASAFRFTVRANQNSMCLISARTGHVSLGSVHFKLKAGKSKTVGLKLSKASRKLLARTHKLRVQITITLTNSGHRRSVAHRTITLSGPRRRRRV